jgi:VanZ family protein
MASSSFATFSLYHSAMSHLRPRHVLRLFFAAALIAVFALALTPVPEGLMLVSWQDKLEHLLVFLGLCVLGASAWPGRGVAVGSGLVLYGAAMEIAQSATAHRYGDIWDWTADCIGIAAGMFVIRLRTKRGKKSGSG